MSIFEDQLYELLDGAPKEGEYWDFKRQWYEKGKKGDLLIDIMNMVNTVHYRDCYIIIGVDDTTGEIVGVNSDKNRLNRQELQDFLRIKPFAQNYYPKTDVSTYKIETKKNIQVEIDVITIFNENNVPIYLYNDAGIPHTQPVKSGFIYSRIGDSNTPRDKSTSDLQMEKLWKKRFGIDRSIYDRFKLALENVEQWEKIDRIDSETEKYIWTIDPDFVVELFSSTENDGKVLVTEYTCSQLNVKCDWSRYRLLYRNNIIKEGFCNSICDFHMKVVSPKLGGIQLQRGLPTRFHYYIYNSLESILTTFLNEKGHESYLDDFYNQFWNNVLVFQNKDEFKRIVNITQRILKRCPGVIKPDRAVVKKLDGKIKSNIGINSNHKLSDTERVCEDQLTVQLMKKIQINVNNYESNTIFPEKWLSFLKEIDLSIKYQYSNTEIYVTIKKDMAFIFKKNMKTDQFEFCTQINKSELIGCLANISINHWKQHYRSNRSSRIVPKWHLDLKIVNHTEYKKFSFDGINNFPKGFEELKSILTLQNNQQ